jgi:hypothetical protein
MPLPPNEQGPGGPPDPGGEPAPQDTFRKIYFGQLSDPLLPEPEVPSSTTEDELTRAALEDPDAYQGEEIDPRPTSWRWVFLLLLAVGALAVVFRKP